MAKQELESLETGELEKRKRFSALLLGILLGLAAFNVAFGAVTGRLDLLAVAAALMAVGLPMFAGLKRINAELGRRGKADT